MPEGEAKSFWDRFDIHTKRWQTVFAGVVALGIIVGFVGNKMGWHWPAWGSEEDSQYKTEELVTEVRAANTGWMDSISVRGDRPLFRVLTSYINLTPEDQRDVVLNLQYDSRLKPVLGTSQLTNTINPDGLGVGDGIAFAGINVGHYGPRATAFVVIAFTLDMVDFPCGDTLVTVRSLVRMGEDTPIGDARYSPQAMIKYSKACNDA